MLTKLDSVESPLGFILSGATIGDEELGYGPARSLSAVEVSDVREALKGVDRSETTLPTMA